MVGRREPTGDGGEKKNEGRGLGCRDGRAGGSRRGGWKGRIITGEWNDRWRARALTYPRAPRRVDGEVTIVVVISDCNVFMDRERGGTT